MLCSLETGGGGGGWIRRYFCPNFSGFLKKINTSSTFCNTKRVNQNDFSEFSATWSITTKLSLGAGWPRAIQFGPMNNEYNKW